MGKKTVRQANMELLRIIAMMGITILHILYWNDAFLLGTNEITGLRIAGSVLESLCVPVVATYVMISGYYDTGIELRPARLLRLLAEVWFYSLGIHLLLRPAGQISSGESIWELARYVLPVMMGHYWFVTAFVVMELFAPLLAAAVDQVSKKTLRGMIAGLLIYESILKTVLPFQLTQDHQGYDLCFFLLLFLKHRRFKGEIFFLYLAGYGIGRAWIEAIRTDQLYIGSTSVPVNMVMGIVLAAVAILAIALISIRKKKTENEQDTEKNE